MPGTRRKRATPPEEPENNNSHASEAAQQEQGAETGEQPVASEETSAPAPTTPSTPTAQEQEAQTPDVGTQAQSLGDSAESAPRSQYDLEGVSAPDQRLQQTEPPQRTEQPAEAPRQEESHAAHTRTHSFAPVPPVPPVTASSPSANGDHHEPQEGVPPPPVERVRRTFRRPLQEQQQTFSQPAQHAQPSQYQQPPQSPQPPQYQQHQPVAAQAPLQPPSHEITLPLGNLLHLAYNPGYTGAEEARSHLLSQLARESKAGGRARCWNCGSIAVVYERWNTRSRTFGEIGIAFCEICGVWSVM